MKIMENKEQQKMSVEETTASILEQAIDIAVAKGCFKKEDVVIVSQALAIAKKALEQVSVNKTPVEAFDQRDVQQNTPH